MPGLWSRAASGGPLLWPVLDRFGDLTPEELAEGENYIYAREWVQSAKASAVSAGSTCLNDMINAYHLNIRNPFAKTERARPKGRGGDKITVLTEDEVDLLCECAEECNPGPYGLVISGAIRFLAETAARPREGSDASTGSGMAL